MKENGTCDNCDKPFPIHPEGHALFYEFVDALGIGRPICICEECLQKLDKPSPLGE